MFSCYKKTVHIFDRTSTDIEKMEKSGNLKWNSTTQCICLKRQEKSHKIPKVKENGKVGEFEMEL